MDKIHKKVLKNCMPYLMAEIQNPSLLSTLLTFPNSDREKIDCVQRNDGPTMATEELVNKLMKRGKHAFEQFLAALRDPSIDQEDIATHIESKENELRTMPIGRVSYSSQSSSGSLHSQSSLESNDSQPFPPLEVQPGNEVVARGWGSTSHTTKNHCAPESAAACMASQSVTTDLAFGGANDTAALKAPPESYYHSRPLPANGMPANGMPTNGMQTIVIPPPAQPRKPGLPKQESGEDSRLSSGNHHSVSKFEPETLLKDIPSLLRDSIVREMNNRSELGNDWKGLAGIMGLKAGDVDTLDHSNSRMVGLFKRMVQKECKVHDLLEWLVVCERNDVISLIKNAPGYTPGHSIEETEPVDDPTVSHEVSENESPPTPQQESANSMSHVNSTIEVQETLMQQVEAASADDADEDGFIPSATLKDMDAQEPDVFYSDLQKRSLIVECLAYQYLTKLDGPLEKEVKKLRRNLSSWDGNVILTKRDVTASKLNRKVDQFVEDCGNDICFVYLLGHTLQINGENYLLPTDIDPISTRADIRYLSLNINSLVHRLSIRSQMQIVIIDGAHHNEFPFTCPGALSGLAPIVPPPKSVIAFPCTPGVVRPLKERMLYVSALGTVLDENPDILLADMFARIRQETKDASSGQPVEFSLLTSLLPFSLNAESSSDNDGNHVGLHLPTSSTERHAVILSNDYHPHYAHVARDTEHLRMALLKLGWNVTPYCNRTSTEMCNILRSDLKKLSGEPLKVVMVYFIGTARQAGEADNRLLGKDSEHAGHVDPWSAVSTQWLIDLMCEFITGPKIVIVDDLQTTKQGLTKLIAPQECLISLPHERKSDRRCEDQSYTLLFSQHLSANLDKSVEAVVRRTSRNQHNVSSNLFYA